MTAGCGAASRYPEGSGIMIEFEHVCMAYRNGARALRDVNFKINDGEFVFITGSSGSGKTTIVRLLLREQTASEGRVLFDGTDLAKIRSKDIPFYRRKLGVVFQDFRLLKDSTVFENIAFARRVVGAPKSEIAKDVTRVLGQVGLSAKYRDYPSQLSGGEQQRVAIARAMVNSPEVMIADEPTGNLDPANAWNIMQLLDEINQQGTTVIVVTHSRDILDGMRRRVIRVRRGTIWSDGEWISNEEKRFLNMRPLRPEKISEEDDEDADGEPADEELTGADQVCGDTDENDQAPAGAAEEDRPEGYGAGEDDDPADGYGAGEDDDPEDGYGTGDDDDQAYDDPDPDLLDATRPIDLSDLPTEEPEEEPWTAGSGAITGEDDEAQWNAAYIEDTEVREAEEVSDTVPLGEEWYRAFLPAEEAE